MSCLLYLYIKFFFKYLHPNIRPFLTILFKLQTKSKWTFVTMQWNSHECQFLNKECIYHKPQMSRTCQKAGLAKSWNFTTSCLLFCKLELITVYTGYDRTKFAGRPSGNLSSSVVKHEIPSIHRSGIKRDHCSALQWEVLSIASLYTCFEWIRDIMSFDLQIDLQHFFHGTRLRVCSDLNPRCHQNVLSTVDLPHLM